MSKSKSTLLGAGLLAPFLIAGCGGGGAGGTAHMPSNDPPAVAAIMDQSVDEDGVLGPIALEVGDAERPAEALMVSVRAVDPSLVPDTGVEILGSGAMRTLFVLPAPGASGSTQMDVQVADANGARSTMRFALDVHALFPGEVSGWLRSVVLPRDELDAAVGEAHDDGSALTGPEDIPRIEFTDDSAEDPTAYDDLLPVDGVQPEDD